MSNNPRMARRQQLPNHPTKTTPSRVCHRRSVRPKEIMSIRQVSLFSNSLTATGACIVIVGALHLVSICKREQNHSRDIAAAFNALCKLVTDAPANASNAPDPRNRLTVQSIAFGPEYFVGPESTGWTIIGGLLLFGTGLSRSVRSGAQRLRDTQAEQDIPPNDR